MKYLISIFIGLFICSGAFAQSHSYKVERNIKTALLLTYNMGAPQNEWVESLNKSFPAHHHVTAEAKIQRNAERFGAGSGKSWKNRYLSTPADITPQLLKNFNGLPVGGAGIPNDNNMAISNDGTVVSVINSSVSIFKSDGTSIRYRTLRTIVNNVLPNLDRTYDPKVLYDPFSDRFILVFLQGSTSADTRIVVGFTKTNNPDGDWNFYAIDGNPFLGKTWSDYPIIAINERDLFITVNILKDDESWQEGFTQSVIWQVNKASGYKGDSLLKDLHYDIKYKDVPVWSICPVQPTPETRDDGIYLLSVRPSALTNDTLFIHRIDGHAGGPEVRLSLKTAVADQPYGVPPSAYQPSAGFRLQTNDTRVLSGFYHQDHIQYVQTTYVPMNGASGIFHGMLFYPEKNNPRIEARYIAHDTFDLAYPSLSSVADANAPYASAITASFSSPAHFPGTLAIYHNKSGSLPSIYGNPVIIRKGDGLINTFLADSMERWGDYTAIQVKYNERNKVWMSGSYGMSTTRNGVWIGQIEIDNAIGIEVLDAGMNIYPIPGEGILRVKLNIPGTGKIIFSCFDALGQVILKQEEEKLMGGEQEWEINLSGMEAGIYYIRAKKEGGGAVYSKKIILSQ
jgi:hypothetical protein